jgi:hypothetical protein
MQPLVPTRTLVVSIGVALSMQWLDMHATSDPPGPVAVEPHRQTGPAWSAEGNQWFAFFGGDVASAGDVNGDGYDDVIVGADNYWNGEFGEGWAFVYHGSPSGPSAAADWTAEPDQTAAEFGFSVRSAGDVNADGYDDVIVGALAFNGGETQEGRAYVFHGSGAGLSPVPDWTAEPNQDFALFGGSVDSAGDVNGDGYDDVIVGAWDYENGQTEEGQAFVFHGSAAGLSTSADWTAEANQAMARFGYSVAGAGDVNGDGYADVIVGAVEYDNGQKDEGRAFVYHGSAAGLATSPDWTAESDQNTALFGASVDGSGDVNRDGFDDVIVGAWLYSNGHLNEGRAFAYYGSAAGISALPDWTAEPNQHSALFGYSVSGAGDVNGDGFADAIVGAYGYDHGEPDEGRASVFCGSANGLKLSPCRRGESNQDEAHHGYSVGGAGDVNGDGYDDRIVGAPHRDHRQLDEGAATVTYGWSG